MITFLRLRGYEPAVVDHHRPGSIAVMATRQHLDSRTTGPWDPRSRATEVLVISLDPLPESTVVELQPSLIAAIETALDVDRRHVARLVTRLTRTGIANLAGTQLRHRVITVEPPRPELFARWIPLLLIQEVVRARLQPVRLPSLDQQSINAAKCEHPSSPRQVIRVSSRASLW